MRHRLLLSGLAVALAACADGYPSADLTDTSGVPHDGAESIAKLNGLGRHAASAEQWRYALKDRCQLNIQRVSPDQTVQQRQLSLPGHWVHIRSREQAGGFKVTLEALTAANQAPEQEIEVFSADKWFDAAAAAHALMLLSGECKQPSEG